MKKILKYKKRIILISIFIILITSLIGLKIYINNRNNKNIKLETETLIKNTEENTKKSKEPEQAIKEETIKKIYCVDIKGSINKPGVYCLEEGKRVQDVIEASEGLTDNSDTSLINLAKLIWDEMVIVVYTKEEVIRSNTKFELNTKINDAYYTTNNNAGTKTTSKDNSTSSTSTSTKTETKTNIININTATKEELTSLSGIGESKAQAIIDYRNEFGNFSTTEDIMKVSGIGQSVYEKIKNYITV